MIASPGRFVWYELLTTDVASATAFYTRVMGCGAWDASAPGRPYVLFGDGKSAISALTPLPAAASRSASGTLFTASLPVSTSPAMVTGSLILAEQDEGVDLL